MEILSNINFNYWILQTVAMAVTVLLIPKLKVSSIFGPLLCVVALAAINAHVWDAALFFSVPDSFTAHTAVLFLANGLMFWIVVKILPGIEVEGFLAALVAPVVFTVCSIAIDAYGSKIDLKALGQSTLNVVREVKQYVDESGATLTPAPTPTNPK